MEEDPEPSISKQLETLKEREAALTKQLEALEHVILGMCLFNDKSTEVDDSTPWSRLLSSKTPISCPSFSRSHLQRWWCRPSLQDALPSRGETLD